MSPFDADTDITVLKNKAIALWGEHRALLVAFDSKQKELERVQRKLEQSREKIEQLKARLEDKKQRKKARKKPNTNKREKTEKDEQTGHGPNKQPLLPKEEIPVPVPEDKTFCPQCNKKMPAWESGETSSEYIDVQVVSYFRRIDRLQKCRCSVHKDEIRTAQVSEKIIPQGHYSINFAVQVSFDKYYLHIPLERQVRAMATQGLMIESQTLWDQVDQVAWWGYDTYEAIRDYVHKSEWIGVDETTWNMLNGDKRAWHVWMSHNKDAVYYTAKPGRGRLQGIEHFGFKPKTIWVENGKKNKKRGKKKVEILVNGYQGILLCDGYAVYKSLSKQKTGLVLANCWGHVLREFREKAMDGFAKESAAFLHAMGELYGIEDEAEGMTVEERTTLRKAKSIPVLEKIEELVYRYGQSAPPQSALHQAIRKLVAQWEGLCRFATDGRIPIDNNQSERVIRHWVIGRKNHFGSKSERGTTVASILYTLIKSAEMSGVDPRAYLRMVVVRGKRGQPALLPNQVTKEHLVEVGLSEEQAVQALQWRAAQNQKAKRGKMRKAAIAPAVACKQAA